MIVLCRRCRHQIWRLVNCIQTRQTLSSSSSTGRGAKSPLDLSEFDSSRIRNFSIIAHVDHGKSTLSDRLLEFTGAIQVSSSNRQVLDRLKIERDRGITVKAQTAALLYKSKRNNILHLLNLIDTPGHVDFNYEVQRSVVASDGVVLLVDANDGVQAQTIANFYLAFGNDLPILPVINKIDLPNADPTAVKRQLNRLFGIEEDEVLEVSAKHGTGIEQVLQAIIDRIPPPTCDTAGGSANFKGLIVDSWFEPFRGAVCLLAAKSGELKAGDSFYSHQSGAQYLVKQVGVFRPTATEIVGLRAGMVGYIVSGMKSTKEAMVGDTLVGRLGVEPLAQFQPAQPMVYSGLYPVTQDEIDSLEASLNKLTLNDASVSVQPDSSPALGRGWRLGFLGLLHMDVFRQRLEEEYSAEVVLTAPSIPYRVKLINDNKAIKDYINEVNGDNVIEVACPDRMPPGQLIEEYFEPVARCTVITPQVCLDNVNQLLLDRRGTIINQSYIDSDRLIIEAKLPLNEIIIDLIEVLKIRTSGFASFHYEESGWQSASLVKLSPHVNDKPIDELVMMITADRAKEKAKQMATKLAEQLPRQQFLVKIQVKVGHKVLASSQIRPYRKDVVQKIKSGTDRSRRQKLLQAQKDGKKRMRMVGDVEIPRDTFIKVLKS